MPVIQKHVYTPAEGNEVVNIDEWLQTATLTAEEKFEFKGAFKNRVGRRELSEALGHLVTSNNETLTEEIWVWSTQQYADEGLQADAVWEKYHAKFLADTNQTYQLVTEVRE